MEPTYVHSDFWPGNTLWRDSTLVAVIDWEGGAIGDPSFDVAYCVVDIRLLEHDAAATRFVSRYAEGSGRSLDNLAYWTLVGLSRPLPDIAIWVPGWNAMGVPMSAEKARSHHRDLIEEALAEVTA